MIDVSIIIPVYNKEKYLKACLDSVFKQSFQNFEVIAVNDGSTDSSLSLLKSFAANDSRLKIIDIPNGGVSNARNTGLMHAKGKLIQFLDGDDTIESEYLTNAVSIAFKNDCDIVFSNFDMVTPSGEIVRSIFTSECGIKNQTQLCKAYIENQTKNGFFGYISNKLFKRSLLDISKATFPVKTKLAEDLHFYAQLYPYVNKAYFWNGNSFRYLQTDTNYVHNTKIDYFSQINIHIDIKKWFIKSKQYELYKNILDDRIAEYAYYIFFYANEENESINKAFDFLRANEMVLTSVKPEHFSGFERKILKYFKNNKLIGIKASFAFRNTLRKIYRLVNK